MAQEIVNNEGGLYTVENRLDSQLPNVSCKPGTSKGAEPPPKVKRQNFSKSRCELERNTLVPVQLTKCLLGKTGDCHASTEANRLKSGASRVETSWRRRRASSGASDLADLRGSHVPLCRLRSHVLPSPGGSELIMITLDDC